MSDSTDRFDRRTFLYGAGSITLAGVLAGCSGGSGGDNGTAGGTTAGGETAAGTDAETAAATDTEMGTESAVGDGTDLESPETDDDDSETESTATETDDDDSEAGNDSETETETTDTDDDDEDNESDEDRGDSERLTYGEIRQQPPSTLDDLNQEYVELINASGSAIDLSGYTITYGEAEYTFDSGFELGVGDQVTVHTGSGDDSDTDVYVGRDEVALDYQGPDDVTVRDADGNVVLEATA